MLHVAIFRSQYAHARLTKVEVDRARAMPGVVAVITFEDIKGVKPIPMRLEPSEDLYRALQRPLASDRLRYVGEPIAVVVAENNYLAEDALEGIDITVEQLEVHVDARRAIKPGSNSSIPVWRAISPTVSWLRPVMSSARWRKQTLYWNRNSISNVTPQCRSKRAALLRNTTRGESC